MSEFNFKAIVASFDTYGDYCFNDCEREGKLTTTVNLIDMLANIRRECCCCGGAVTAP
jgi:hypothetical protein